MAKDEVAKTTTKMGNNIFGTLGVNFSSQISPVKLEASIYFTLFLLTIYPSPWFVRVHYGINSS